MPDIKDILVYPACDMNKYTRGTALIVAGSACYPGAACLASDAAYKMGAGYVELVCSSHTLAIAQIHNPEIVARSWDGWRAQSSRISYSLENKPCACLIGCGFDSSDTFLQELTRDVLTNCQHTVVVDGGALSFVSHEPIASIVRERTDAGLDTILTPHFGEAKCLSDSCSIRVPDVNNASRNLCANWALELSDAYRSTVVLKGPVTYIANSAKQPLGVIQMDQGTSALAKAGTGDVLAGMIVGLTSQGQDAAIAAYCAATIHAKAASIAAESLTDICVGASDVVAAIPKAIM